MARKVLTAKTLPFDTTKKLLQEVVRLEVKSKGGRLKPGTKVFIGSESFNLC